MTDITDYYEIPNAEGSSFSDLTVKTENGWITVLTGGTISDSLATEGGTIEIMDGGIFNNATVTGDAMIEIRNGAVLSSGLATAQGMILVEFDTGTSDKPGFIQNVSATEGGYVWVNGSATNLTAVSGGQFDIVTLGKLSTATILDGGTGIVTFGASATDVTVNKGGQFLAESATIDKTIVSEGGSFTVQKEKTTAADTTILDGGYMKVIESGVAQDTEVTGGQFVVSAGGTALMTVLKKGSMVVREGTALDTTVEAGKLELISGTAATTVIKGGEVSAISSSTVQDITLSGGILFASSATVSCAIINEEAILTVIGGEVLTPTMNGGQFNASSTAVSSAVIKGGTVNFTGATVSDFKLAAEAEVALDSESTLIGKAVFAEGTSITVDGTIEFDTAFTSSTEAQIQDISAVTGDTTYTLKGATELGTYLLATGASEFSSDVKFGGNILKLNEEPVKIGSLYYSLSLTGDNLELAIDDEPPPEPQPGEKPVIVYVNSQWSTKSEGDIVKIGSTSATIGINAFADGDVATAAVADDGKVRVAGGTVNFASGITKDTTAYSGSEITNSNVAATGILFINKNAVLTGKASFAEGASITVNGTVAFDTAFATAESAQFSGLSLVKGKATYTLNAEAVNGTYLLATGAVGFASDVVFGDTTLELGKLSFVGKNSYLVTLSEEGDLVLTIDDKKLAPHVYVNYSWLTKDDGDTVTVGDITATIGYDAFATGDKAAMGVTDDGTITILGGNISFTNPLGNATAVQSGASIRDSAITGALTVESGAAAVNISVTSGTMTVADGATLSGKASFGEGTTITVNGTIEFDTVYADASKAQITGLSKVTGSATYTLTDTMKADGVYLLATDAAGFSAPVQFGDVTLTVGASPVLVGDYKYSLAINENSELVLNVVSPTVKPTTVYVNSEWSDKVKDDTVTVGSITATIGYDAFATGDEAVAFIDGDASVSRNIVFLSDGSAKTLLGFDGITIIADSRVYLGEFFAGKTITIDATDYANFTKQVMVTTGGFAEGATVSVLGEGFSYAYHGTDTLLIVSSIVKDTYANTDWTEEDVNDTFSDDGVSLVWDTNAFNSFATAGTKLGKNGSLYLTGGTSAESITLEKAENNIVVTANTACTVAGTITGAGGTFTVKGEFLCPTSISGFSLVTVKAGGSLTVNSSLELTENGILNWDLTGLKPGYKDALIDKFSNVLGTPTFTVTVTDEQELGNYLLASDASVFLNDILINGFAVTPNGSSLVIGKNSYSLAIADDKLILTVAERPVPGIVYVNSEWTGLKDDMPVKVGDETLWIGYNAFATGDAAAAAPGEGAITVVAGDVSFTNPVAKTLTIDDGATLTGKATFNAAVTLDGTIAFSTAYADAENAQISGFSKVSSGETAQYTLTVEGEIKTGTYLLASDAEGFNNAVKFNDVTLTVGAPAVTVGEYKYSLSITTKNELALKIAEVGPEPGPALVYANSQWSDKKDGDTVTIGEITATVGYDAFANYADAVQGVADDGSIKVVGGSVTFAYAIARDTMVMADAVIVGKGVFNDNLTVDGLVAFDTAYASAVSAQFSGISSIKGTPKYSLTVSGEVKTGTYLLASGATGFSAPVKFNDVTLLVDAEPVTIGDYKYSLTITPDLDLALTIAEASPGPQPGKPTIVYANSKWANKEDGDLVTVSGVTATIGYNAFATGDAAVAGVTDDGSVRVTGGIITFTDAIVKPTTVLTGATVSGASVTGTLTAQSGAIINGIVVSATGVLTVSVGGTLTGSVSFADEASVTVNGTLMFNTAYATVAQVGNLAAIKGTPTYSLKDDVKAPGTYVLATDAASFSSTVKFSSYKLTVGADPIRVGNYTYKIAVSDLDRLELTVGAYEPPMVLPVTVYVNTEWADTAYGTVVTIGEESATVGIDAFADGDTANCSVAEGGKIYLLNGAASFSENAKNVTVSSGAELDLDSAVKVSDLTILDGGAMVASGGALVEGFTLSGAGISAAITGATVKNGAVTGRTYAEAGENNQCSVTVGEDGLVQSATVGTGGVITLASGGLAEAIVLTGPADTEDYGALDVHDGAHASNVIVSSAGYMNNNGIVDGIEIMDGGQAYTRGILNDVIVHGTLGIEAGGSASGVTVADGGSLWTVNSAGFGTILNTVVSSGGTATMNGYASGTQLLGGTMILATGAVAENTSVGAGGKLTVSGFSYEEKTSSGIARGVTVEYGASVEVLSYGKLTGKVTVAEETSITMGEHSILDFDISPLPEPEATPLLNDYEAIAGDPDLTLTVIDEQVYGTYLLAGNAAGFNKTITVNDTTGTTLGTLTVDGNELKTDKRKFSLSINKNDILTLTVASLVDPINGPDDGTNNYLYDKKQDPPWNPERDNFVVNNMQYGVNEIYLDEFGLVDKDGKHNFVGKLDGFSPDTDTADYAKIKLSTGASLTFNIDSDIAGKYFVYQVIDDPKKGQVMKKLLGKDVKAGKITTTKTLHLEAGEYYVAVQGAIAKKGETKGFYNVTIDTAAENYRYYIDADDGWNSWLVKQNEAGVWLFNDALLDNPLKRGSDVVSLDTGTISVDGYTNFVGFTDEIDCAKFQLNSDANLSFTVTATDKSKVTLFRIDKKVKETKKSVTISYVAKKITSATLKLDKETGLYTATTKAQLLTVLEPAEEAALQCYYIAVESKNAKKGGNAYYNVSVGEDTVFFDSVDDGMNDWLYDKKNKEYNDDENLVKNEIIATTPEDGQAIHLDSNVIMLEGYENFVGYDDPADYAKLSLESGGSLSFRIAATGDATFEVYRKGKDKKGKDILETLQTTKFKLAKDTEQVEVTTAQLKLDAGDYYISMTAKNSNVKGNVFYNVDAFFTAAVGDARTEDALAAASGLESIQDDKAAWQSLASLA